MKKRILWLAVDLTVAALVVLAVWIMNYKIPQGGIKEAEMQPDSLTAANVVMDTQDWHEKFADKFTDTVIATDTSYTSPDLSIQLSYSHYDTGILDLSESGKHKKYGTEVSYVLADIYMGDITCFQTAFARNTYGTGYLAQACWMKMEKRRNPFSHGAILRNPIPGRRSGILSRGTTACC